MDQEEIKKKTLNKCLYKTNETNQTILDKQRK
jgi:hypothetical protein